MDRHLCDAVRHHVRVQLRVFQEIMIRKSMSVAVAVLALSCASHLRGVAAEDAYRIVCNRLRDAGAGDGEILRLRETSPLFYDSALLYALKPNATAAEFSAASDLDEHREREFKPSPLGAAEGPCRWRVVNPTFRQPPLQLLVQLSPVIRNPYVSPDEYGVFAKSSFALGQAGRYWWIPLPAGSKDVIELDISSSP